MDNVLQEELPVQLKQLAELFKVLGDNTRIKILYKLMNEGELCVGEIAEGVGMGQSAISHQLRVLRQARLVTYRKHGKTVLYKLDDDHVDILIKQALEHVQHG